MKKTDAELDMIFFLRLQEKAKQEAQEANIQQSADRIRLARSDMGIPLQVGESHTCHHATCAPLSEAMCIAKRLLPAHTPIINPNVYLCRRWRVHHCVPSDCYMVGVCTISAIERTKLYQRGKEQPWVKPDMGTKKKKKKAIKEILTYVRNPKKRGAFRQLPCQEDEEGEEEREEGSSEAEEDEPQEKKGKGGHDEDKAEGTEETATARGEGARILKKRKVARRVVTLHR